MGDKGLDFKHKEVININNGKRLGFVQDVCADLEIGKITQIIVPGSNKIMNIFLQIMKLLFHVLKLQKYTNTLKLFNCKVALKRLEAFTNVKSKVFLLHSNKIYLLCVRVNPGAFFCG